MASCRACGAEVVRGVPECASCGVAIPESGWRKTVVVVVVALVPVALMTIFFFSRFAGTTASGKIELKSRTLGTFSLEMDRCRYPKKTKPPLLVIDATKQAGRELYVQDQRVLLRVRLPEGGWREVKLDRQSCRYFSVDIQTSNQRRGRSWRYHGLAYLTCALPDGGTFSSAVHFQGCI